MTIGISYKIRSKKNPGRRLSRISTERWNNPVYYYSRLESGMECETKTGDVEIKGCKVFSHIRILHVLYAIRIYPQV